jgi:hypothetical protein
MCLGDIRNFKVPNLQFAAFCLLFQSISIILDVKLDSPLQT